MGEIREGLGDWHPGFSGHLKPSFGAST